MILPSVLSLLLRVLPPQDQLAADMYSFFAKEGDYACYFLTVSAVCHNQHVKNV